MATPEDGGWRLDFRWPDEPERHVDLMLAEHLEGWAPGLGQMVEAVRRQGRVTTALYDTWTLVSWAEWAAASRPDPGARLTILHVDDHRDLMAPRLFVEDGGWRDPITGGAFDFRRPDSVRRALESGAVGMGSFLTPVLHAFPNAEVRHLCQPPKAPSTAVFEIQRRLTPDDLIDLDAMRPAIQLVPDVHAGAGRYMLTPDVQDWLKDLAPGPVLLHIDMDYFNNRFDGDGDWAERPERLDPPAEAVIANIGSVADALQRDGLVSRIEDAVIAYSPGFFPSELWNAAEHALREHLGELYG
ncbi:hypothetical protein [Phenylobacterium zucineum]|uniref:hypothetical protein n=1 Tax=Phenylobacterium zucineum TaxID=284016 RepID=UPI00191BEA5E|nr:hypothetical protein [Phenylobacterium zucineum]